MKQKLTHRKYMGVPPGSSLRRGWRKQKWADEKANCNALAPEASLDFQRQFWSWKGPPVIPLWGEGAGVLSCPPHCQLLNEAYSGWRVCVLSHFSHIQLYATLRTVTHQAPLSMEFSRQGYWNGLPCPPPGDLPNPGIEPASLNVSCIFGRPVLYHWHHLGIPKASQ